MPGIYIGIGGIGGSIVAQVRQALNVRVAFAGDSPSAQSAASQFEFLLIDTWKDGASQGFDQAQVFDLPDGRDKFGVDAKIESWYYGNDLTFRGWWPERRGAPWRAGDFATGAGQLRVKGKLAYRIALSGQGRPVARAAQDALHRIDSVFGPAPGTRTVPVYLVCSLGGGTGSGMVLTFAQHLRQILPPYCPLVGVFPLASVTELGPGGADTQSIWANTDAALRELDYCQRVAGTPDNAMTPFFQWPGDGNVLFGRQRPFEYVYLFGRENQSGLALNTFSQYVDLIAESLIAESFSTLIDEGLQNGISGPHSQFIMQLQARPEIAGQATTYASAAVGSLMYPAERIERHLARRYAGAVLDRMLHVPRSAVTARVDEFFKQEKLTWDGSPRFETRLREPLLDKTGRPTPLPTFNRDLSYENNEEYQKVTQANSAGYVNGVREQFDAFAGERYSQHLRKRRQIVVAEYAAADGGIRALVHTLLNEGGASGLGLAHAVVNQVKLNLQRQWTEINELLEGNDTAATPTKGRKAEYAERKDRWQGGVNQLARNGFGGGLTRPFNRNGKAGKERFTKTVWNSYRDGALDLERLLASRQAYQELITETNKVAAVLNSLVASVKFLHHDLEQSTRTDIGKHGKSGVLDVAALDDPRLVAHHFDSLLNEVVAQRSEACATEVTRARPRVDAATVLVDDEEPAVEALALQDSAVPHAGIVLETFDRKLDPKTGGSSLITANFRDQLMNAIVADGIAGLGGEVRRLSIWEALAAECIAREQLNMEDAAVTSAISAVQADRAAADLAGVPPKDWEREVLRHFIRNRLFECQKRVRPFWNLNGLMVANFGHPYHFIVLATDREAYREADTTLGIGDVLESTATLMQAGTPKWLPGRDQIVLYAREGVAPLCYLNERELKHLRDAAAQKRKEKFLYTDLRFETVADEVIRPGEQPEDARRFTIALGLHLGAINRNTPNGHGTPAGLILADGREFTNVVALDEAMERDPVLRREVMTTVNAVLEQVRVNERDGELYQTLNLAKTWHQQAQLVNNGPEARWWKYAEQSILARMTYGQHFVTA